MSLWWSTRVGTSYPTANGTTTIIAGSSISTVDSSRCPRVHGHCSGDPKRSAPMRVAAEAASDAARTELDHVPRWQGIIAHSR